MNNIELKTVMICGECMQEAKLECTDHNIIETNAIRTHDLQEWIHERETPDIPVLSHLMPPNELENIKGYNRALEDLRRGIGVKSD
ncbi:hypothetical protein KAR91_44590 [Candidatus Pacearchaeota archaeon]|nr:hypothetical protein [Candidatus Pacearchaeota archaeon]